MATHHSVSSQATPATPLTLSVQVAIGHTESSRERASLSQVSHFIPLLLLILCIRHLSLMQYYQVNLSSASLFRRVAASDIMILFLHYHQH